MDNANTTPTSPRVHIIPFWETRTPSFSEVIALTREYYIVRLAAPYAYGIVLELTPNNRVNTHVI